MALVGDRKHAEPGAGIQPGVAIGERREGVDRIVRRPEVPAVLEVRDGHLPEFRCRFPERGIRVRQDLGRVQGLGEQRLVLVDLRLEFRSHARRHGGAVPKATGSNPRSGPRAQGK